MKTIKIKAVKAPKQSVAFEPGTMKLSKNVKVGKFKVEKLEPKINLKTTRT